MGRQIIDLSIAIEAGLPSDPEMMIPKIHYVDHARGAEQMTQFFPGLQKHQLPDGLGWSLEFIHLTTHSGTHLDAPFHYHPTMDRGAPALTIDQVPLGWCFQDGVLLDFSAKPDGERITVPDLEQRLDHIGYRLKRQELFGAAEFKFTLDCLDAPYYIHLILAIPSDATISNQTIFQGGAG